MALSCLSAEVGEWANGYKNHQDGGGVILKAEHLSRAHPLMSTAGLIDIHIAK